MNERFRSSPELNYEEPSADVAKEYAADSAEANSQEGAPDNTKWQDRLEYGENFFRELSGIPDSYHVSAEHKILFSMISNDKDRSNFPVPYREEAVFTTFGFEYKNGRLPFLPQYQSLIHQSILRKYLAESKGADDFYSHLDKENHHWQEAIKNYIYENLFNSFRQQFNEQKTQHDDIKKELVNKQNATRRRIEKDADKTRDDIINQEYQEQFYKYILDNKILTPGEIDDYRFRRDTIHRICTDFTSEIRKFTYNNKETGEGHEKDYTKLIDRKMRRFLEGIADREIKSIEKDKETDFKESTILELKKRIPKGPERVDADVQKEDIINFVKEHYGINTDELEKIINNAEKRCNRYFGHLAPRYIEAYSDFFFQDSETVEDIRKKYHGTSGKEYRENAEREWLDKKMQTIIDNIKESARSVAFSDLDNEASELFFLPTGIIAKSESGLPKSVLISPLDNRILDGINNPEIREVWEKSWETRQQAYDDISRNVIETILKHNMYRSMDITDREIAIFIRELAEKDQIEVQKAFDPLTGRVYSGIQPDDINTIKSLSSDFGGFIDTIDFCVPKREVSLKDTRLEIIDFLSGRSSGENLMLAKKGQGLNIDSIRELLMNAGPEKQDKAYSRIASELGIVLYNQLSNKERIQYDRIVGNSANVSRTNFYRAYRENIVDPDKRRKITERTLFLRDFINYTKGSSNNIISDFFDNLKKKPAIKG